MESDDDFELSAPPEQPSPPLAAPKMKRLKKLTHVSLMDEVVAVSCDVPTPRPGSVEKGNGNETEDAPIAVETRLNFEHVSEEMEYGGEIGVGDLEMDESECLSGNFEGMTENQSSGTSRGERELGAKRALDFDSVDGEAGEGKLGKGDLEINGSVKQSDASEGIEEGKIKKRKMRSKGDGEDLEGSKAVSKRRSEKERREYLNQLHAESQRLLRETRDAGFKPAPAVHKPISSVLDKIRKRKLELQKQTVNRSSTYYVVDDDDDDDLQFDEGVTKLDSESIPLVGKTDAGLSNQVNEVQVGDTLEVECGFKEASVHRYEVTDEDPTSSLRAPICDTQDLFGDSEASEPKNGIPSESNEDESPLEEKFVPSVLAMNLRFDSALPDSEEEDQYSDEEDNDKENAVPHPPIPRGDPVQAFVDDEAIEEDDSDNDQLRFQENDDDDFAEDAEDLNDMIATNYEENQIDHEKRQELHMKMLEQQDAEGIDNLLQKYKCGSKLKEPSVLEDQDGMEEDEDEDESCDKALETEAPKNSLRQCVKKAKQMIVHMFTDNEDVYVSSEDEELETRVVNRVFRKTDEQKKLEPTVVDESSREVFGLIKKLNIASEIKKKAKISSFDTITTKSISFSKPSFLGRTSSNSLSSSRKHGSSVTRAFVFARDDSNSRSSIAVSEDSDTVYKEVQPTMPSTAKFSQSQTKQKLKDTMENVAGTSSLFEILRRSTVQQHNQDVIVGRTQSVFSSFKLPKRSKIEGKLM
ncbi:hypothetical protein QQ045_026978 [Rhodiola kirilowii]